jgi:hypothetical protein
LGEDFGLWVGFGWWFWFWVEFVWLFGDGFSAAGASAEVDLVEEALGQAFGAVFWGDELGEGCEEAEGGVEFHLVLEVVDCVFVARSFAAGTLDGLGGLAGQGADGDLEAEDEEAGALGVELVGGDAGEDLRDGELDGGAVFEDGQGEGFERGLRGGADDGAAGGMMVEAEVLAAQGGAAAAAAAGEDVAALEARLDGLGFGLEFGLHGLPPGVFL